MIQETQFQPVNIIGDFYRNRASNSSQAKTAKNSSSKFDIDNLSFEDFAKLAIGIESIIRLGRGVSSFSSGAFSSPLYMLAAGSLMTNWLGPVIGSDGASLDGSLERSLQKPPSFHQQTLTEQIAEADANVATAKANRKAIRESAIEEAKSVLKATSHKVKKKSKTEKISTEDKAKRDLEFTTAIRDAKGNVAAALARVKTGKAGNTTEEELASSQKQLTKTQVHLAALEHARDNGLGVDEAKVAASTILSKMDGIDTAISEASIKSTSRTGNWFTGLFKARTTSIQSQDIPSAYSAIAMNYEDIENTLNQFGSSVLRNTVEANTHYSQAREIHTEASVV